LVWRSRILGSSATSSGVTLALDIFSRIDRSGGSEQRMLGSQALDIVLHVTEVAMREGFWVELRAAQPCHDPQESHWFCAALLCLTRQSSPFDPGVAGPCRPAAITRPGRPPQPPITSSRPVLIHPAPKG
jgi:hypothetical protein